MCNYKNFVWLHRLLPLILRRRRSTSACGRLDGAAIRQELSQEQFALGVSFTCSTSFRAVRSTAGASTTASTSRSSASLISWSRGLSRASDGEEFTSMSQGLRSASMSMSYLLTTSHRCGKTVYVQGVKIVPKQLECCRVPRDHVLNAIQALTHHVHNAEPQSICVDTALLHALKAKLERDLAAATLTVCGHAQED